MEHSARSDVGTARRILRWFGVLCVPVLLAASYSFVSALTAPGNLSTTERSVEWLRGHHFGDTVSWAETTYYSHNQPPKGGALNGTLPKAATNAPAGSTVGPSGGAANAGGVTGQSAVVDRIAPLAMHPVAGEGVWQPYGDTSSGATAMQVAYLRPDDIHGTVLAAVVRIDQAKAALRLIPGAQEPGNGPWKGGNQVARTDVPNMLAAFNSGFRIADSRGGFAEAGRTVSRLRDGAASVVIAGDGRVDVVDWGRDANASNHPVAVRQNLDLIVDGGQLVDGLDSNTGDRWGKTVGNKLFVWRSGIGIDASGRLLYVASEGLSVTTLASLLQHAGAVRAMELDINHSWVSFNVFHHAANASVQGTKLLPGMDKSATRYLSADDRDFFAVISRTPLVTE